MTNAPSVPPTPTNKSNNRFTKNSRLLKSVEFRKVYDNGSRFSCPYFVAFLFRHPSAPGSNPEVLRTTGPRVGFTIPRAVGKAVIRNRIRRRIREQLRLHLRELDACLDIVLNPRRAAAEAPLPDLIRQLERLMERCRA
ncbi:MAG TPA: ribonuclease P protein component [Bryobacteraceae bacterium]|nr:ribonuclease P protein component [Bryobacteraceae bacterium]